ncbi:MAG: protein-disulfide reductase DsbD domain-containing protein [Fimbriimonadaceae bacterium]
MRSFRFSLFLTLALLAGIAFGQIPEPDVSFELTERQASPSETVDGQVVLVFSPGLHGYQNPPSKDYMIPVAVTAGNGTTLASVTYPKGKGLPVGGETEPVPVYSGRTVIPVKIEAPDEAGSHAVNLKVRYQQCDDLMCYRPMTVDVTATLTVQASQPAPPDPAPPVDEPQERDNPQEDRPVSDRQNRDSETEEADTEADEDYPSAPSIRLNFDPEEATVGEAVEGEVIITFAPGLHGYQNPPSKDSMIPVEITVAGDHVLNVDYPVGRGLAVGGETEPVPVYSGRTVIPFTIIFTEEGEQDVEFRVRYQQCDDALCYRPETESLTTSLNVLPGAEGALFESESEAEDDAAQGTEDDDEDPLGEDSEGFISGLTDDAFGDQNYGLIAIAGILVGLTLTLTPCVYPMIPITVSFFSNQADGSRGYKTLLGGMYTLGIAITYGLVGGILAALGQAVGQLFANPIFNIAIGLLLLGLALSMFGVYEIGIPRFIGKHLKSRQGPVGALIMGLLLGFAAAPCAGAFITAFAVAVAETQSVPFGIFSFVAIGLGIGLPFMALAAVSTGTGKMLPRAGGWMTAVKAVLGLVVVYFAVRYFIQGFGLTGVSYAPLIWAGVLAVFAIFLLFFEHSDVTKPVLRIKGVAVLVLGLLMGINVYTYQQDRMMEALASEGGGVAVATEVDWKPYSEDLFAEAVASGQPILVKGTADWCTNCKVIENNVFEKPEGILAMQDVFAIKVDWSTGTPEQYLDETSEEFGIAGLPHMVFIEPGDESRFDLQDLRDPDALKENLRKIGADV